MRLATFDPTQLDPRGFDLGLAALYRLRLGRAAGELVDFAQAVEDLAVGWGFGQREVVLCYRGGEISLRFGYLATVARELAR